MSIKFALHVAALVLAAALLVAGCSDDPTRADITPLPSALVETWVLDRAGRIVNLRDVFGWPPNTDSASLTLTSENTFVYEERDIQRSVTYTSRGTFVVIGHRFTLTTLTDDAPATLASAASIRPGTFSGTWTIYPCSTDCVRHSLVLTFSNSGDAVEIWSYSESFQLDECDCPEQ